VARKPKAKKPPVKKGPSGRMVVLAFAIAIGSAVALIAVALFLRGGDDGNAPAPSPTPAVDLTGIPQDGIFLGADSANVTLIEYADLQCPFCRVYSEDVFPTIVDEYVRPGRVKTEFRGLAFIGEDSVEARRYVLAAGLQDRLWQLQEALYRNQGDENSGWVTDDLLERLAGENGLDWSRLKTDAASAEVTQEIDATSAEAARRQVPGTPTFFVQIGDGEPYVVQPSSLSIDAFRPILDDALDG
jgi:protein-disulfide isomerase